MTISKILAIIAAITSLALFGNSVMFQSPTTEIAAQTVTPSSTETAESDSSTEQSSEKESAEASASSEETDPAEHTTASSETIEQPAASTENVPATETIPSSEPVEEAAPAAPVVEEPAPVAEAVVEAQPVVTEEPPAIEPVQMQPNMLQIAGALIPYSNAGQGSGQAVIDANHGAAATWGGAPVQSGTDGMNTHIIGHNPGAFNALFSLGVGSTIEVSDGAGQISTYTVQNIVTVDDSAYGLDGTDYWDQITGTGGGERLTLQTCINDYQNLIVFAA